MVASMSQASQRLDDILDLEAEEALDVVMSDGGEDEEADLVAMEAEMERRRHLERNSQKHDSYSDVSDSDDLDLLQLDSKIKDAEERAAEEKALLERHPTGVSGDMHKLKYVREKRRLAGLQEIRKQERDARAVKLAAASRSPVLPPKKRHTRFVPSDDSEDEDVNAKKTKADLDAYKHMLIIKKLWDQRREREVKHAAEQSLVDQIKLKNHLGQSATNLISGKALVDASSAAATVAKDEPAVIDLCKAVSDKEKFIERSIILGGGWSLKVHVNSFPSAGGIASYEAISIIKNVESKDKDGVLKEKALSIDLPIRLAEPLLQACDLISEHIGEKSDPTMADIEASMQSLGGSGDKLIGDVSNFVTPGVPKATYKVDELFMVRGETAEWGNKIPYEVISFIRCGKKDFVLSLPSKYFKAFRMTLKFHVDCIKRRARGPG